MKLHNVLRHSLLLVCVIILTETLAFCAQEYNPSSEPTIVAPGGLSEREQESLRRDYTYQVRRKDTLLTPYQGTSYVADIETPVAETEGERYHSYVGAAIDLYKTGRLEEAEKILLYLNEVDPKDDYVKSYLARVRREMQPDRTGWKNKAASEAAVLKKQKLDGLLRDGIDAYNIRDFNNALVSFRDALALEPKNTTANTYMQKLKTHYSNKAQADLFVTNVKTKNASPSIENTAAPILARKSAGAENVNTKKTEFNRKVDDMLNDVEFGAQADAVIAAKRAEEARADQLVLGPGDLLKLSILNHAELSGEILVRSTGEVSLPLTGDAVRAKGLTLDELKRNITMALDKYIQSPTVNLSVINLRSQIFYVLDDASCTPYPITKPDLTLRDALFISDWGNNRALGRVIVMKPSQHNPIIKKVDAFNLIYRGDLRNNVRISNGDVIYIPMTVAAKTTKLIYDTLAPFSAVRAARDSYLDMKWNTQDYKNFFREPETYDDMSQSATSNNNGGGYGGGYGGAGYNGYGGGYY